MKKKSLAHLEGQDKIVGRPIRLNQVEMKIKPGKDYAELLFWGDVHYGHPECDIKAAKENLQYAIDKGIYIIGMGDYIESGTRDSVGDSVYQQKLNPQKQMDHMIEIMRPAADAGLLIGIHTGNHEFRINKSTSIDIVKIMAKDLGVSYLGYAVWNLLKVNGQKYSMYSQHGKSGSKFKHTKIKALIDQLGWIRADIVAQGHVHEIFAGPVINQEVDFRNRVVKEKKTMVVLTGSYIRWDRSYAQAGAMPMTTIGSPKIKIFTNKHSVHASV